MLIVLSLNGDRLEKDMSTSSEPTPSYAGPDCLQSRPDCMIIWSGKPGKRPHVCDALLEQHSNIEILAVTSESNASFLLLDLPLEIHSSCIECSEESS
jgi:hypothetical protein